MHAARYYRPDMSLSFSSIAMRTTVIAGALLAASACASTSTQTRVEVSSAADPASAGMVDVATLAPDIRIDMRYAGTGNFVGDRIDGYEAPRCYLHRKAAEALATVQAGLRGQGQSLVVYDCYRPVRAVQHFVRWARDAGDQRNKARYYPEIDKGRLFEAGYIATESGHSRGSTIDLGLLQCDGEQCDAVDMGSGYDLFDSRSHTDSSDVAAGQRANRHRLRDLMAAAGFANYAKEWWHFTYRPEPTPGTAFDFPVR